MLRACVISTAIAASAAAAAGPAAAHAHARDTAAPCAVPVRLPDEVRHVREQILVKPAGSVDKVIPAVTREVDQRVQASPATVETITHPAVFKTVWKTVEAPGRPRRVRSPPVYRTVTERVLVAPAHVEWRPGAGRPLGGEAQPGAVSVVPTGEVMCSVLVPARYALRSRRVLVSAGEPRTVPGPVVRRRVSERVLVSPERVERIAHPAVFRIERRTEIVTPARTVTLRTPPVWTVIERTTTVSRTGLRPARCARPAPPRRRPPEPVPYGERG